MSGRDLPRAAGRIATNLESELKHEKMGKKHFSNVNIATSRELAEKEEMLQLGRDYYNSGKSLEDLDISIRNHRFFIVGYEHAKRLAHIAELEQKDMVSKKSR